MPYADKAMIALLSKGNWHGYTIPELVCEFQQLADDHEQIISKGTQGIPFQCPTNCPQNEWLQLHLLALNTRMQSIISEVERREDSKVSPIVVNNQPLILTIKAKLKIEDVIERYTQVFTDKSQWQYRCTLHGDGNDEHPSGAIYQQEQRFWCFVCNQGGDVIDAVRLFERIPLSTAIAKLAAELGLSTKPMARRKGGFSTDVDKAV